MSAGACINTISRRSFFAKFFKNTLEKARQRNVEQFGKYSIVEPGIVSPILKVPPYIPKPEYSETGEPAEPPKEPEIKDKNQIECMIHSCLLAKKVLKTIRPDVKANVTTDYLDKKIHELIVNNGAYPSPLNYKGFPKSICTSINNVACHGIPDDRALVDGDILNIDVTVYHNGFHGDCSEMFEVGEVDDEGKRLIQVAEECLMTAIGICKPNEKFCSIGNIIEETAYKHNYNVLPAFGGHGIGAYFHGPPDIYHFENEFEGVMKPGMTFTIEPILTQGGHDVCILDDGWTAVTVDSARTAQIEHTILITDHGADILTRPN
ncbi:methionine aminopeptidase 1D, mitochondrial [Copidosoma floridanum]|uniref:methionine aminopeptidase 1D, mitochondrial n=1 Tax=Copidosoma floridanum TaxID=29053 RepID=UPI0006C9A834|nr:methionine aminopeptidase 1D, mitochondrial [Copidosoma floridanum]